MKIHIETIPHHKQRYKTVGDYYMQDGVLQVRVSHTKDDHDFLIIIHELVEWYIAQKRGKTIKEIDQYDLLFEEMRFNYPNIVKDMEPGNMESNPYFEEHQFATDIEKQVSVELGVDWNKYEKIIDKL